MPNSDPRAKARARARASLALMRDEDDAQITAAAENDPDNPPLTEADLARFRPAAVTSPDLVAAHKRRGPKTGAAGAKTQVTLRIDPDVVAHFRDTGPRMAGTDKRHAAQGGWTISRHCATSSQGGQGRPRRTSRFRRSKHQPVSWPQRAQRNRAPGIDQGSRRHVVAQALIAIHEAAQDLPAGHVSIQGQRRAHHIRSSLPRLSMARRDLSAASIGGGLIAANKNALRMVKDTPV